MLNERAANAARQAQDEMAREIVQALADIANTHKTPRLARLALLMTQAQEWAAREARGTEEPTPATAADAADTGERVKARCPLCKAATLVIEPSGALRCTALHCNWHGSGPMTSSPATAADAGEGMKPPAWQGPGRKITATHIVPINGQWTTRPTTDCDHDFPPESETERSNYEVACWTCSRCGGTLCFEVGQ